MDYRDRYFSPLICACLHPVYQAGPYILVMALAREAAGALLSLLYDVRQSLASRGSSHGPGVAFQSTFSMLRAVFDNDHRTRWDPLEWRRPLVQVAESSLKAGTIFEAGGPEKLIKDFPPAILGVTDAVKWEARAMGRLRRVKGGHTLVIALTRDTAGTLISIVEGARKATSSKYFWPGLEDLHDCSLHLFGSECKRCDNWHYPELTAIDNTRTGSVSVTPTGLKFLIDRLTYGVDTIE